MPQAVLLRACVGQSLHGLVVRENHKVNQRREAVAIMTERSVLL